MQVWNVLHAACWKYRMQKWRKKIAIIAPSHKLSGWIFATAGMYRQSEKNFLNSNISTCPTIWRTLAHYSVWDPFGSLGQLSKFQRVSHIGFVTAATSFIGGQPYFARCLAVSWAATLYIHFRGSCSLTEFHHVQNSLCVQLFAFSYIGSVTSWHSSSGRQPNFAALYHTGNGITELSQTAPFIFGWAAITLGIGPHSSSLWPPCVEAEDIIFLAPSVQRRKVWLTPTTIVPCSYAAKTRNPLKLPGVPQTNEMISAASMPKFTILCGHVEEILLLNNFFRLSTRASFAKI